MILGGVFLCDGDAPFVEIIGAQILIQGLVGRIGVHIALIALYGGLLQARRLQRLHIGVLRVEHGDRRGDAHQNEGKDGKKQCERKPHGVAQKVAAPELERRAERQACGEVGQGFGRFLLRRRGGVGDDLPVRKFDDPVAEGFGKSPVVGDDKHEPLLGERF